MAQLGPAHRYAMYEGVKPPKGYHLRYGPDNGVVLCADDNGKWFARLEEMTDVTDMSRAFAVVFPEDRDVKGKKFCGGDLEEVFLRACAYHRLTSTTKG